jgi:hypothetical protein
VPRSLRSISSCEPTCRSRSRMLARGTSKVISLLR